jgi:hypothetical protein
MCFLALHNKPKKTIQNKIYLQKTLKLETKASWN